MTLSEIQAEFALDIARLLFWCERNGYRVTLGDAYRDPRVFGRQGEVRGYGRGRSAHKQRLAVDLNLFLRTDTGWKYVKSSAHHQPLGRYWKTLHPHNVWGGDFASPDGNHYSRKHGGIA